MPETIKISKEAKEELLRVAAELQAKEGRRVDLDEAIKYLLTKGGRAKRPELLDAACKKTEGFETAYQEMMTERRRYEERTHRKYGV
ncbi:MAG: hypothetical protein QXV32_06710 [Conexivisphaerales archaeon]